MNTGGITAILACPNRELARLFHGKVVAAGMVQIIEDIASYPSASQLEAKLRQQRPDALFVDLSQDVETGLQLIAAASASTVVVGLHVANDANVIIRSLRAGGSEFLTPPFDEESVQAAFGRLRKSIASRPDAVEARGKIYAFTGVKAGQGVTTVASNVAAAIAAQAGQRRVLLLDFDSIASSLSFAWRVTHPYSFMDAIQHADKLDDALWAALAVNRNGVDILLGPETPQAAPMDSSRYEAVLEYARSAYDYVVLDCPSLYEPAARAALHGCEHIHVICNAELPSLHLTRKSIAFLEQQGFSREQLSLIVNRISRRSELGPQDMERVFNFPITKVLPEDDGAIHRALTAGKPVANAAALGRELQAIGVALLGKAEGKSEKKKGAAGLSLSALLSQG